MTVKLDSQLAQAPGLGGLVRHFHPMNFLAPTKPRSRALLLSLLFPIASLAALPASAAPALLASEDGAWVIDQRARMAWARCVEGMQWNGSTCTGQPLLLDHEQATARAAARAKDEQLRLRLPRAKELQKLFDKTATPPGLDPDLFPAAPRDWHWSSTTNIYTATVNQYSYGNVMQGRTAENTNRMALRQAWAVHLGTGEGLGDTPKKSRLLVRLVCPID